MTHALFSALAAALGLSPDSPEASLRIRQAWTNPTPPPAPPGLNVVYFSLFPGPAAPLSETSRGPGGGPEFFRFADYSLQLVFYGPDAEALAWRVWHRILLDGPGCPRRILRVRGIYPIPGGPGPLLVHEQWTKEHRPRVDLTVPVRVAVTETDEPGSDGRIDTPPDAVIHV